MRRYYSLKDLRDMLTIEIRNDSTNPRFTEDELNLAISRACADMRPYFWDEEQDSSKTTDESTYSYTYDFPVEDIVRVEIVQTNGPIQIVTDFLVDVLPEGGATLYLLSSHAGGQTLRVWYERHPIAYPEDLTLSSAIANGTTTTFTVTEDNNYAEWPESGYLKIEGELMSYTFDRDDREFTVVRGSLGSPAGSHATTHPVSFVNIIRNQAFISGVLDMAQFYLSRLRLIDAPSGDVQGNVTIMRGIEDALPRWIRMHRMRSTRNQPTVNRSRSMRSR